MGGKLVNVVFTSDGAAKIKKWKVKIGTVVSPRQTIFIYDAIAESVDKDLKFKCMQVGTVRQLIAKEGDIIQPGDVLLELEECTHPTVMKDMCAECGADLRNDDHLNINASVPMVHSIPELKVSQEQAEIIGKADEDRLLADRKLVLLVDLDQTLIHTTNDNIPPNLKDVYHYRLYGPLSPWHHTRIRPRTHIFLEEISKYYELHICTFGARNYAHTIAVFLDPVGKFFSHRILSRDECFNANSKIANLKALFPCGDSMVCIIDDREDVWNYAANLIHVKPYHFFRHTGDINAPPGLTKKENDEIEGYDFTDMEKIPTELGQNNISEEEKQIRKINFIKDKIEILGESTTDKDTEDEEEERPPKKILSDDIFDKIAGDLQLSEDDTGDTFNEHDEQEKTKSDFKKSDTEKEDNSLTEYTKEVKTNTTSVINENNEDKVGDEPEVIKSIQTVEINSSFDISGEGSNDSSILMIEEKVKAIKEPEMKERVDVITVQEENKDIITVQEENKDVTTVQEESKDVKTVQKESKEVITIQEASNCAAAEIAKPEDSEKLFEVMDSDDYLMYLEDILKSIHKAYYDEYDALKDKNNVGSIPDLKVIIPRVKKNVLKGCNLVFSGMIPLNKPLEKSRAYMVAVSLGATVSQDITPNCTHLVAARPGTAKIISSRRYKGIYVVTPSWLWHCAERWQRVDERLYPLGRGVAVHRHPPAHCSSPERNIYDENEVYDPALRNRNPSAKFIDTINPLLTFSPEDRKLMDQEVADLFKDDDNDDDDDDDNGDDDNDDETESECEEQKSLRRKCLPKLDSSTSSEDSLSGGTHPKGWDTEKENSRKRKADTTTCTDSEYEDESPSVKFRRGEPLPSDLDLGDDSQDSPPASDEPMDDSDDTDWNMMGAALEREFLSKD